MTVGRLTIKYFRNVSVAISISMEHSAAEQEKVTGQAYRNRYIIMVIVLAGIFMSVLDGIVVSIALPTMTSYFNVDLTSSQWITTAYLLTITSLLLVCGKVSDYTGRVPMFTAGIGIFMIGSLAWPQHQPGHARGIPRPAGRGRRDDVQYQRRHHLPVIPCRREGQGDGIHRLYSGYRQHPRAHPGRLRH
jgi:hypothetical protein